MRICKWNNDNKLNRTLIEIQSAFIVVIEIALIEFLKVQYVQSTIVTAFINIDFLLFRKVQS